MNGPFLFVLFLSATFLQASAVCPNFSTVCLRTVSCPSGCQEVPCDISTRYTVLAGKRCMAAGTGAPPSGPRAPAVPLPPLRRPAPRPPQRRIPLPSSPSPRPRRRVPPPPPPPAPSASPSSSPMPEAELPDMSESPEATAEPLPPAVAAGDDAKRVPVLDSGLMDDLRGPMEDIMQGLGLPVGATDGRCGGGCRLVGRPDAQQVCGMMGCGIKRCQRNGYNAIGWECVAERR